jgi:DNA-binding transcriptional LysR family regulator
MAEVSLKQLRCFIAVYAERSFTRAAKSLSMAQSPVSQAIASLEKGLGQQLFTRHSREVVPTPAAHALYPEALELRRRAELLPHIAADAVAGEPTRHIRLGAITSAFPSIVAGVLQALPQYSFTVSDGTSAALTRSVDRGDIDACIVREFGGGRDGAEKVAFRELLIVAVHSGHALANENSIAIEDLHDEPTITFKRENAPISFDLTAGVFTQAGRTMRIAAQVSSEQAILGLVAAGEGFALVPQSVGLHPWHGVSFVPLTNAQATYPITVRTAADDPLHILEPLTDALAQWASATILDP